MQRKFKFALCIFLAIVALLCTVSAADIYVSWESQYGVWYHRNPIAAHYLSKLNY